ncbi:MAG: hypothetical protein COB23_03635 [Methylophaga sp.]|nr:MAG: hypothetical protein COB23_03635 [Methylophaga sp.]
MKLIYTHENRLLVFNIQNIVENAGISIILKNEYAAGAVGDLVPHETWVELWVKDDSDYDKAMHIIESSCNTINAAGWVCHHCTEKNDASFDFCWHCHNSAP